MLGTAFSISLISVAHSTTPWRSAEQRSTFSDLFLLFCCGHLVAQDDVLVDDLKDTVVVHYTVTAAHLLPQADGSEATGHVSVVSGMDKMKFTG